MSSVDDRTIRNTVVIQDLRPERPARSGDIKEQPQTDVAVQREIGERARGLSAADVFAASRAGQLAGVEGARRALGGTGGAAPPGGETMPPPALQTPSVAGAGEAGMRSPSTTARVVRAPVRVMNAPKGATGTRK